MSEECTHDCNSCGQNCGSRSPESLVATPYKGTKIGKIIGVVSGKGGVGKSMVTDLLAVSLAKKGYKVGILDADITGPSIPAAFGLTEKATSNDEVMFSWSIPKSCTSLLCPSICFWTVESDPVIWRGPIIAGTVKQFYTEVAWGELDYLLVDMPPGTGDVPLTVFQSITVDGIIVVTSPQQLVSMIVEKAVNMASLMNIPVYGIVENMSYALCPDCGKKIFVFGESKVEETATKHKVPVLAQIPIQPELASACDNGQVESLDDFFYGQCLPYFRKRGRIIWVQESAMYLAAENVPTAPLPLKRKIW